MKTFNKTSRSIIATLIAGGALLAGGSAFAQQRVFVENGHEPIAYGQPHMVPMGVSLLRRPPLLGPRRVDAQSPARS
jgi:hypothetical protein